jgi:tyrosinase
MSSTTGFGGNGNTNRSEYNAPTDRTISCIDSGPFKDLRPEYLANTPTEITEGGHCFFRSVAEANEPEAWASMKNSLTPEYVANQQKLETFAKFAPDLEASPHGTIHASLGGEMNPTTSPNGEYRFAFDMMLSVQVTNKTSRATFLPPPPTNRSSMVDLAAAESGEACS